MLVHDNDKKLNTTDPSWFPQYPTERCRSREYPRPWRAAQHHYHNGRAVKLSEVLPYETRRVTHGANDKNLGRAARLLLTILEGLLDRFDQGILVNVRDLSGQRLALRVRQLPSPVLDCQSGTCITSRPTES